jgi:hypothetical protein
MTLAAAAYWLAMAAVIAWAGLRPEALALFHLFATAVVYPLGWGLTRLGGGDLFARGHEWSGLLLTVAAAPWLAWPLLLTLFLRDRDLLAFALAAILGAHFLPYAWLYRSRAYLVLACVTVLLAGALQWAWPRASLPIALAMAACYTGAALWAWRENRRCPAP